MPILNYTTSISVEKTVAEIQRRLAKAGAQAILTEYDPDAVMSAVSFKINGPFGILTFRLPANVDKVQTVLRRQPKVPRWMHNDRQQSARVAWRIVKDWIAAQLAMIESEMVTLCQVFLPYAQDAKGQTVYERLEQKSFEGLALPAPK